MTVIFARGAGEDLPLCLLWVKNQPLICKQPSPPPVCFWRMPVSFRGVLGNIDNGFHHTVEQISEKARSYFRHKQGCIDILGPCITAVATSVKRGSFVITAFPEKIQGYFQNPKYSASKLHEAPSFQQCDQILSPRIFQCLWQLGCLVKIPGKSSWTHCMQFLKEKIVVFIESDCR